MQTFTTRTQAIDFLVAQGKPLNKVKVAIDQGFNYDGIDQATPEGADLIAHAYDFVGDPTAKQATEQDVISTYNTFCGPDGYYKLTDKGFVFDGNTNPSYDVNGNPL